MSVPNADFYSIIPLAQLSVSSQPLMKVMEDAYDSAVAVNTSRNYGSEVPVDVRNSQLSRQMETVNKFNATTQKEVIAALKASADFNVQNDDTDVAFKLALTVSIVKSIFNKLRSKRKPLISETAVLAAYNSGLHDSAVEKSKQSGQTIYKVWRSMRDPGVREAHRDLEGQRMPITQAFSVDGVSIRFPRDPLAPPSLTMNCRCFLSFET